MNTDHRQFESHKVRNVPFDAVQFVREHDAAGERLTVIHKHGKREGLVTRTSNYAPVGGWRRRRRELLESYRAAPGAREKLVEHLERLGRIVDWST
ncbi:MAG: hypothetical protein HKN11_20300 [Rhizobiales bacterium]|nr:hypothetical protein [Hyphomicrobiales bacterium]